MRQQNGVRNVSYLRSNLCEMTKKTPARPKYCDICSIMGLPENRFRLFCGLCRGVTLRALPLSHICTFCENRARRRCTSDKGRVIFSGRDEVSVELSRFQHELCFTKPHRASVFGHVKSRSESAFLSLVVVASAVFSAERQRLSIAFVKE